MDINAVLHANRGRLYIPLKSFVSSSNKGELWLNSTIPYIVSDQPTPQTLRILTHLDIGQLVAGLDGNGHVPVSQLPQALQDYIAANANVAYEAPAYVGEIRLWAGHPLRLPSNKWLLCDGSQISKTQYPELFQAIGGFWGQSPAVGSFFLPDLTGKVVIGAAPASSYVTSGKVHKIVVHDGGTGFVDGSHVVTGLSTSGSATQTVAGQFRIIVSGASVQAVEVLSGGQYSGVETVVNPLTVESDTNMQLPNGPWRTSGSTGLRYSIVLVGQASNQYGWGVRVTHRGSGYTSDPEVVITGGLSQDITARAVRSAHNDIVAIIVTNPGNNNPTGATVTITGGGGSGATAQIVRWETPIAPGDIGGQHWHYQQPTEVGSHNHSYIGSNSHSGSMSGPSDRADPATAVLATGFNPSPVPMPMLPSFAGVSYIIRAKP